MNADEFESCLADLIGYLIFPYFVLVPGVVKPNDIQRCIAVFLNSNLKYVTYMYID